MMKRPRLLLAMGVTLLFLGVILPFLMVIQVLEPTFFLLFFSSGSSTVGFGLGMLGFTQWSRSSKKK
jgi:hypothetical protein